jgi:hypothetical protein
MIIIIEKKAPTVGFEPTTYGLEVHRAIQLRYAGSYL